MNRNPLNPLTAPVTRRASLAMAASLVGAIALAACSDPGSGAAGQAPRPPGRRPRTGSTASS